MNEELARLRAEMDQMREGLKEIAASLWTFYSELTEQGFKADQALRLTVTFFREQLRGTPSEGDDA